MSQVVLKPGKEKPLKNRHHWIFSGAVAKFPKFADGDCLEVVSAEKELLGIAYFNKKATIVGRMLAFEGTTPEQAVTGALAKAYALRKQLFSKEQTNAYRLVNGEGDCLPGLVVDCYGDILVLQISTLGMEKLRPIVVEQLNALLSPRAIYEKSLLPSRAEEGIAEYQGSLSGEIPTKPVEIVENGLRFNVSILHGQKTGFFLDQREMRNWVRGLSQEKRVLNCFGYTGGFSVYAAVGGALAVDTVDISAAAIEMAEKNMALNGQSGTPYQFFAEDAFQFLRERPLDYDLVILDPPAFAKRKRDVVAACRGYKDINRLAMQKMPPGSLLVTCSCSYHVDEPLFQTVVFQASVEAGRTVRILGRHRMAADHPINLCHREGDYLKSLLLYVE